VEGSVADAQEGHSGSEDNVSGNISGSFETVTDELQLPESGTAAGREQAHTDNSIIGTPSVSPVTPLVSMFDGEQSSPVSSDDSEPVRFRNLNDIYDDTSEIDLPDSDVEAMLAEVEEPSCYREAADHQDWIVAMDLEMQSIEKNKTWKLAKLPAGKKPICLKWVFKLKRNSEGEVVKHKARLVAKGHVQKFGVDFEEVFAPVARLDTVIFLLAFAANHGWKVHHLDVKSAFLHGELEGEVYVS